MNAGTFSTRLSKGIRAKMKELHGYGGSVTTTTQIAKRQKKEEEEGGISCEKSYKSSFGSSVPWYHMVPLVPGTGTSGTWYHTGSITSVF